MRDQDWTDRMTRLAFFGCIDTPSHILFVSLKKSPKYLPFIFPTKSVPLLWRNTTIWAFFGVPVAQLTTCSRGGLWRPFKWSPRQRVAAAAPWGPHVNPAVHRMTQNLAGGYGIAQKQRAFGHFFFVASTRWGPTNMINRVNKNPCKWPKIHG